MPQHTRLSLLLLAFVVLAGVYSLVTPPFETPDEIWHYAFIQHLASGRGLPVAQPNTQELWRQQGSQAPAYYLAAAGLTAWLDQSDFRAIYGRANPHAAIGRPDAIANRNYLIHHQDEGWPWRGAILALHIARFFSILLAAATLWATYRTLALLVQPDLALAATALIGFIPQFIFISAAASNDNAINALASLTLWQIVALTVGDHAHPAFGAAADENLTPDPSPARRGEAAGAPPPSQGGGRGVGAIFRSPGLRSRFVLLGCLLGLALLSKLSAIGLVGLAGLAVTTVAWRQRSWRLLIEGVLAVAAPAILIAGWWYARNWLLYRDLLAWNVWEANILLRVAPAGWRTIVAELGSLERSFWGLFGWLNVPYPAWVYAAFRAWMILLALGLAIAAARWITGTRITRLESRQVVHAVCAATAGEKTRSIPSAGSGQALSGTSPLLGEVESKDAVIVQTAPASFDCVRRSFDCAALRSGPPDSAQDAYAGIFGTDRSWGRGLAGGLLIAWLLLLAVSWVRFMRVAPAAQGRYFFPAAPALALVCALAINGLRTGCALIPQASKLHTRFATTIWLWLPVAGLCALSAITPAWIIAPAYRPPPSLGPAALQATAVDAQLGDQFAILGVGATPARLQPGETAEVTVIWRALQPGPTDYSVFVHLRNEIGLIVAQADTMPGGGLLPTSQWPPGHTRAERYRVATPSTAYAPDRGEWAVGLYDHRTGQRLPLRLVSSTPTTAGKGDIAPRSEGDAFVFGAVEIAAQPGAHPNPINVAFDDNVTLAGYSFSARRLRPGQPFNVTLYWQPRGPIGGRYTTFAHLLDRRYQTRGGHDGEPAPPTAEWRTNEIIVDRHDFVVAPDAPPGLYQVEIGMYTRPDFRRLLLVVATGAEGADRLLLGPLMVEVQ